ncbi:MAG: glycosyltransferase family 2 protein [Micrococcaceae bacterium]
MINLVMPMAGRGSRFTKEGYTTPKPLIQINGKPFFYWSIRSIEKFVNLSSLIVVVLQEHIDDFHIDQKIKKYFPKAEIVAITEVTEGAVITSLKGSEKITNDKPIVFNDCDHMFYCPDFYTFCKTKDISEVDGGLLTFTSNEPKYSFAELDKNGHFVRTVEKVAVSDHAICGAYYFKDKNTFETSAKTYLKDCEYSEYFMSGVYNVLAKEGKNIVIFSTDTQVGFGTTEEYKEAKMSSKFSLLN